MQTTRESVLYLDTIRSKGRWPEKCRQRERSFPPVTLIRSGTKYTQDKVGREFFKEPSTVPMHPGLLILAREALLENTFGIFVSHHPESGVLTTTREWSGGATVNSSALHVLCVYTFLFTTLLRYTAETFWRVTFRRKRSPTTNAHSEAPTDHALRFLFQIPTHECHRFYLLFSFMPLDGIFRRKGKLLRDCGG